MAITFFFLLQILLCVAAFQHPGLLVSQNDISRIKSKLAARLEPWQGSWDELTGLKFSQSDYTNNAVAAINRDASGNAPANADLLWHDAAAAFNLGLRWRIEGDSQYAEAAADILAAWSKTLHTLGDNDDQYLVAGLQGYQLANAAELIRDYVPFANSGLEAFSDMFRDVFLSANLYFLQHQAGSEHNHQHFFANWELCNMASAMAFGILTDNQTLFDFVVDYFKTGTGNGAINLGISNLVEEPSTGVTLGQPQEAGRDQGHTGMDVQLWGVVAQQAWNQNTDLYGYNNSRILQGIEYYARYNLGNNVPFEPYTNGIVSYDTISESSRGSYRPTWELLYAHYAQIKGLSAPWTEKYKNYTLESMGGFEGGAGSWGEGSGHYDGLGWGSLLYHLDSSDVGKGAASPNVSSTLAHTSLKATSTQARSSSAKQTHWHSSHTNLTGPHTTQSQILSIYPTSTPQAELTTNGTPTAASPRVVFVTSIVHSTKYICPTVAINAASSI